MNAISNRRKTRTERRRRERRLTAGIQRLETRHLLAASVGVSVQSPAAVEENPHREIVYVFHRDDPSDDLSIRFSITGEATYDADYIVDEAKRDTIWIPQDPPVGEPLTGTATFRAGESTVEMVVIPRADQIIERSETVIVSVVDADEFGSVVGGAAKIERREDTVYYVVDDQNRLGIVDVETGYVSVLGEITSGQQLTDIAFTEDGDLFGISQERLYEIELQSIAELMIPTRLIGEHGVGNATALVDARDEDFGSEAGDLFAVGEDLLHLEWLDMEVVDDQWDLVQTDTVMDLDQALAAIPYFSDYVASGDLGYLSSGRLILSARRPSEPYDSLIEIETPGQVGLIDDGPIPARDPSEDFQDIFGFAFDGNDSYAFAGRTMLDVNQFSLDVARARELTGRSYDILSPSSAVGTIIGDPVDPPTITFNTLPIDPPNRPAGAQPTSWLQQRSDLRDIRVELGAKIPSIPADSVALFHLGVSTDDAPTPIALAPSALSLDPSGSVLRIEFEPGQLPDGRFQLVLSPDITTGPEFVVEGDLGNRFFINRGDFDGNSRVDLRDVTTLAYWFGVNTPAAPRYVDLDGSGAIDFADLVRFQDQFAGIIEFPGVDEEPDPVLVSQSELQRAFASILQPADVNGTDGVTPLDALTVINRIATQDQPLLDWRFDVDRNGTITPGDALFVVNWIAVNASSAEQAMFRTRHDSAADRMDIALAVDDDNDEPTDDAIVFVDTVLF